MSDTPRTSAARKYTENEDGTYSGGWIKDMAKLEIDLAAMRERAETNALEASGVRGASNRWRVKKEAELDALRSRAEKAEDSYRRERECRLNLERMSGEQDAELAAMRDSMNKQRLLHSVEIADERERAEKAERVARQWQTETLQLRTELADEKANADTMKDSIYGTGGWQDITANLEAELGELRQALSIERNDLRVAEAELDKARGAIAEYLAAFDEWATVPGVSCKRSGVARDKLRAALPADAEPVKDVCACLRKAHNGGYMWGCEGSPFPVHKEPLTDKCPSCGKKVEVV